jgi:Caspase domain
MLNSEFAFPVPAVSPMRARLAASARRIATVSAIFASLVGAAWMPEAKAAAATESYLRAPRSGGRVRALVIGIDAYRYVRPLRGAAADARDVEQALLRMGVADLTTLIDDQADRVTVMQAIAGLVERSGPGDLVILSIAGHGAQEPERVKGSEPDGKDDVFLLAGFETSRAGSEQRIIGTEFNHIIKQLEQRGAQVLFVADTCHGGGLAREIDPRADELSYRQVSGYQIADDGLKPISTSSDAFLSELDFARTTVLAAVNRETKSPEIRIPGIPGFRGALSYAAARALEGLADADNDGKVTLKELFGYVRQVVYQLSDQRQNPVTLNPPGQDIDHEEAFEVVRSVTLLDGGAAAAKATADTKAAAAKSGAANEVPTLTVIDAAPPSLSAPAPLQPVRIAVLDGKANRLSDLTQRVAHFEVVPPSQEPDLVWDPTSGDVLAGPDVVARGIGAGDLPGIVDRVAALRTVKQLAARAPQPIRALPDDRLHRDGAKISVEIGDVGSRALILFDIADDGSVQALYPTGRDPTMVTTAQLVVPVRVREPFGADEIVAITSDQPMPALQEALKQLDQRRAAMQIVDAIVRLGPANARIGATGIFTSR